MALGYLRALGGGEVIGWSGGSAPGPALNPMAVAAMNEEGIDITGEFPKPWTDEIVLESDVVVTMGCGDTCPVFPGKRYLDWELDDPAGQDIETVRRIRDEIRLRVEQLIKELTSANRH
jgi:protein-tyrosine-phosphatase